MENPHADSPFVFIEAGDIVNSAVLTNLNIKFTIILLSQLSFINYKNL